MRHLLPATRGGRRTVKGPGKECVGVYMSKRKKMCGLMEYLGYNHGAAQGSGIVSYNLEFALLIS